MTYLRFYFSILMVVFLPFVLLMRTAKTLRESFLLLAFGKEAVDYMLAKLEEDYIEKRAALKRLKNFI